MKTGKILLAAWFTTALLASCVSKHKYHEALTANKNQQEQYARLTDSYNALEKEKEKLQASTSEELSKKQKELEKDEKALKEREKKIKELSDVMSAQRDAVANLKKEVCSALKCFTPDELTVEVREGKLYVSMADKLLFPSGSDKVDERGKQAISMLAAVLANSDMEIMVEGHTDNVPINTLRYKDNWDLSVDRATSVVRIFTDNNIPSRRIIASGRGEYHPIAGNETEKGRGQNRRTEIVLAPKLDKLWQLTNQGEIEGVSHSGK
ncbi:MAG TPA: OmpA family protein [Bacteroidia bacterium]|nr:OmpA family protein [Bacteroidia bacterium]